MVKPEKFDNLHLVYHFPEPLNVAYHFAGAAICYACSEVIL